ncbi:IL17RC isoform 23 [Pongo abelii]|uniref:IL17RC isoform 23 n=1 Tax=Pongo abelii TaxID=9601 RepID=A0A2J8WDM3_PONAB|nr:IL17RC isoform 23 [Pongo abelii]
MPVPWFLLSLALGRSPVVLSLERLVGPQDATHCSPGLSCHLWGATKFWAWNSFSSHPPLHTQTVTYSACLGTSCLLRAPCWRLHICRQSWC